MVLHSSDEQERELRRVLDEQQDKKSANYHQWVTPEQFGDHFGVHDSDITKVSAWLQSHGFQVEDVSKSKRVIHFSGTTGQLESAFKTEIHSYQVGTETHVSNNSEISVPEALSPVIAGVTMNDFFRKGHIGPVRRMKDVKAAELSQPLYSANTTTHYIGPWDFATIYNTFPLLNKGVTGAGSRATGRSSTCPRTIRSSSMPARTMASSQVTTESLTST
jgi:subtilase family serine protease